MEFLASVSIVCAYGAAIFCLGARAWSLLKGLSGAEEAAFSPAAAAASSFLLGCGLFGFFWLCLGLAGWFSPIVVSFSLAAGMAWGLLPAYELARRLVRTMGGALLEIMDRGILWTLFGALCLVLLACLGAASFAGPVVVGSDASSFYMVLPKMMAFTGHLQPLTDSVAKHSTFGFMGEMHYAAGMALGAGSTAKAISFFAASALMLLVFSIGSLVGLDRRGQLILLAMLLSSSAYTNYVCDGKVDTFPAAFGIAALYWALQARKAPEKLVLSMLGLMLGWSVYSKLSMLIVVAPMVTLLFLWRNHVLGAAPAWSGEYWRTQARVILVLAFFGLILLLPLAVKNWLFFQEPFAPVYYFSKSWGAWFKVRSYTPEELRRFLVAYPFALSYGKYFSQGGTISPLILAFVPLVFWLPKGGDWRKSPLCQMSFCALVSIVIWVVLFPKGIGPRYILPALIALAPLAAKALVHLMQVEVKPRLVSFAAWILLLFVPFIYAGEGFADYQMGPLHFWRKLNNPEYMGRSAAMGEHPVITAINYLNKHTDPGKRVLLGMNYRYWLRPDILASLPDTKEYGLIVDRNTPAERWQQLAKRGFQYLIIDNLTHNYLYKIFNLDRSKTNSIIDYRKDNERYKITREYNLGRWSIFKLKRIKETF